MNGTTKKHVTNQLINWIGIAVICFVSFYFTANARLDQHDKDIECIEIEKIDEDVYQEYVKRVDDLI